LISFCLEERLTRKPLLAVVLPTAVAALVSLDHIKYEVTIEDPMVFTRPWTMSMPLYRRQEPNVQLLEYACYEDLTLEKFFPGKR